MDVKGMCGNRDWGYNNQNVRYKLYEIIREQTQQKFFSFFKLSV